MTEVPLISVVVPTLNQARFIEQALASITGQNWPANGTHRGRRWKHGWHARHRGAVSDDALYFRT
jgi:hypothetical protein